MKQGSLCSPRSLPFQSPTTDEIHRRAKERDYEWPSSETSQKYISPEAKDLVATMLQDADMRPDPDTILEHPSSPSGYMPVPADNHVAARDIPPGESCFLSRDIQPTSRGGAIFRLSRLCAPNVGRRSLAELEDGFQEHLEGDGG